MKKFKIGKIVIFITLFIVILTGISYVLKPIWYEWNNYDTINAFYEQPEDTIEVAFIGTSTIMQSIIPMELYEDYGIASYNFGTELQPMMASYYWLAEALDYNEETLDTVVLDVSMVRKVAEDAAYEKAFLEMKFSVNKLNAIRACSDTLDDFIADICNLFAYHDRWKELTSQDFTVKDYEVDLSERGYNFSNEVYLDYNNYDYAYIIPGSIEDSTSTYDMVDESEFYLYEIIAFCEENDIELILTKIPQFDWTEAEHNEIQLIADEYGLEFYDFYYDTCMEEAGLNLATDMICDANHMNYYGATKLTEWFGEYLTTNLDTTDVRTDENYDFMGEELENYKRSIVEIELDETMDVYEYIDILNSYGDYTIFLTVKNEASNALTDEQRDNFEAIGLTQLAEIGWRDSYIGVIEDGEVIYESLEYLAENEEWDDRYLSYKGVLEDGTTYSLISGGGWQSNMSYCTLDGVEYSYMCSGINVTVYDNLTGSVLETTYFDTGSSSIRLPINVEAQLEYLLENGAVLDDLTDDARNLYLYNLRCEDYYLVRNINQSEGELDIYGYLTQFWDNENYVILLSVLDDGITYLDEEARSNLADIGLVELSALDYQDSYVAIINAGDVLVEDKADNGTYIEEEILDYKVSSGTVDSMEVSCITIDSVAYNQETSGVNVVVYNKATGLIVDSRTFNTEIDIEVEE